MHHNAQGDKESYAFLQPFRRDGNLLQFFQAVFQRELLHKFLHRRRKTAVRPLAGVGQGCPHAAVRLARENIVLPQRGQRTGSQRLTVRLFHITFAAGGGCAGAVQAAHRHQTGVACIQQRHGAGFFKAIHKIETAAIPTQAGTLTVLIAQPGVGRTFKKQELRHAVLCLPPHVRAFLTSGEKSRGR